jgi:hypothetical protein
MGSLGNFYFRKYPILAPLLGKEGLGEVYARFATAQSSASLRDLTPLPAASPLAKGRVKIRDALSFTLRFRLQRRLQRRRGGLI